MNNKLHDGLLLDEKGNLVEAGYATSLIKDYDRNMIKASKWRIKEWDYYYVGDDNFGIAMTIDDNGYMGLVSVHILDFINKKFTNKANIFWFPFGKVKMPSTSKKGTAKYKGKNYYALFLNENNERTLYLKDGKVKGKPFEVKIILKETSKNSLVVATPFNKNKHFYYNQKINNLKASGHFIWGDFKYTFKDNAFGVLDWGRGVWTYANTWYWGSCSGQYKNDIIGFNLGYGFGDTSHASENMLFINDKAYKLDDVTFDIPKNNLGGDDFMGRWKIYSKSKDIDLIFTPILDRHDKANAAVIGQDAHQVFGRYSGTFTVDGQTIEIKEMMGFAEKVKNHW